MAHSLSRALSPFLNTLWRLVRLLFGGSSGPVVDAESGNLAPVVTLKDEVVKHDPIPTFVPELNSIPALILSSMVVGAAVSPKITIRVPTIAVPGGPPVPRIVLTPPEDEKQELASAARTSIAEPVGEQPQHKSQGGRAPLGSIGNIAPRVHGKTPSKTRVKEQKENLRHPNAPRVIKPSPVGSRPSTVHAGKNVNVAMSPKTIKRSDFMKAIQEVKRKHTEPVKATEPGSSAWEHQKSAHLAQARAFSEDLKARRRSLPTPAPSSSSSFPADPQPFRRSASAPGRLSLEERLRRVVADRKPVVPALPLWGDDNVSFVVEEGEEEEMGAFDGPPEAQSTLANSSSSDSVTSFGSISSILKTFEDDIKSPIWLDRQRFSDADLESARVRNVRDSGSSSNSRDSTWSDVFSLDDYI